MVDLVVGVRVDDHVQILRWPTVVSPWVGVCIDFEGRQKRCMFNREMRSGAGENSRRDHGIRSRPT